MYDDISENGIKGEKLKQKYDINNEVFRFEHLNLKGS